MAEGMMTLEQEMAAFGESMPPPGDAGGGDDGAHSDEDWYNILNIITLKKSIVFI